MTHSDESDVERRHRELIAAMDRRIRTAKILLAIAAVTLAGAIATLIVRLAG